MLLLLINGVLLGLGAAAPIGPINVEIARRTLRFGRGAGFLLGCGAVTVDVCYAVITSFTFLPIQNHPHLVKGLSIAAAAFLLYLAYRCLQSGLAGHGTAAEDIAPAPARRPPGAAHYATGLLLTALNPMTLGFWFVAVPGAVAGLTARPRIDLPVVCAGVFLGAFAWVCAFTALVGHLKRFGGQRWLGWIDIGGGLMLLAFAVRAIWRVAASTL
ncbi:MAG: Lysine exporter protein [Phycisphaerales bacterium]|nr:Lysine exporter protein [Phycisphaerales bacterium]